MRLNSTSWIVRGWITFVLVTFYAQNVVSKSLQCDEKHYSRGSRCCKKCEPGFRVFSDCTDSQQTRCVKCHHGEYQPGWTEETRCLLQKFCDRVKGFLPRPENPVAEEPCPCQAGHQCHPIKCEYCEKIPACSVGHGLEADPESTNGRKICVACRKGFFSAENSAEPCKQWTNCKAEGRRETQAGTAQSDAMCGPHVSGAAPSWVIVSVLSVITVLCLLILLLFCYKDKLKLLSVNLRSCVQNLKRTRIQQETFPPLYHSGAGGGIGGGGPGGPKCETAKLISQAPNGLTDELPCSFPTSAPEIKVSLPFITENTKQKGPEGMPAVMEDRSEGSGEPEEVSEEDEEVTSVSPLLAGPCVCVIPVREPLEVGENEDCSQAVSPGTPGTCSCGGFDGEEAEKEAKSEKTVANGEGKAAEKTVSSKSESGAASLVSLSPQLAHASSVIPPSNPLPELCLPLSQAHAGQEFKPRPAPKSPVKQQEGEELYGLASAESTSTENGAVTSALTSLGPLMSSASSVGDLYREKTGEAVNSERGQGLSLGNELSSVVSHLDCSPESLHSQLAETTLTSGQVSGNNNTTFISSGQVMNFSGDVIVVYVSQSSVGGEGAGPDDAFGSPVQEQANETAPFCQSTPTGSRSVTDSGGSLRCTLQHETMPVQEMRQERLMGK